MKREAPARGRTLRNASGAVFAVLALGFSSLLVPALAVHPAGYLEAFQPEPAADAGQPGLAAPAVAEPEPDGTEREAVVTLRDGQRFSGILVDRTADQIVLKIAGINMPIRMSLVDRVSVQPPMMEVYRDIRASIDDGDVEQLLHLVEWLRARGQWSLALLEVDHVLTIQPDHPGARRLKLLITSQKTLSERSKPGGPAKAPRDPAVPADTDPEPAATEGVKLLSGRDINLIKVYEVDLANPPRMVVERETIQRLIEEHPTDPLIPGTVAGREALYRASPSRILDLMFRMQARNLYPEVKVLDHPKSMKAFRDDVHGTWIVNMCATNRCHGGAEAGRLRLASRMPNTEPVVYTNFLILDRFRLPDGTPLINYDEPTKSPLLHLGLPRDISLFKHPAVHGVEGHGDIWRPFFSSTDDRRFVEAVNWIKVMYRPRPEYPVDLPAPPPPAPTQPPAPPVVR